MKASFHPRPHVLLAGAAFAAALAAGTTLLAPAPAAACTVNPATTLIPSRTELPAGYRLPDGTVLQKATVTTEAMRVAVDTTGCNVTHVPASFAGFIYFVDVRNR